MYPRRRSGGCCSGFALVLIFILFLGFYILMPTSSGYVEAMPESGAYYNEESFQDFADSMYAKEFGSSSAYEDNLLIAVLVDESYTDYYYIAWVGDHIVTHINYMLGNNDTELGQTMNACISTSSYKYSLDSNLAQVMESMTSQIQDLGLASSYSCTEDHAQVTSHLTNRSSLEMTEATVNDALTAFTEATGIPVVIVVEDMEDVFGTTTTVETTSGSRTSMVFLLVVVALAVGIIFFVVKKNKSNSWDGTPDDSQQTQNRYSDFE